MIKKLSVGNIQLDNYPEREMILLLDQELGEAGMSSYWEVSAELLLLADKDEQVRRVLQEADHTILVDAGILRMAGESGRTRRREIEEHGFFHGLMKRMERNHKSIFLLGESTAGVGRLRQLILESYPRCEIEETAALSDCTGATDSIINEINAAAVDIIIAALHAPEQEYFWLENRDKLSASLYYGLDINHLVGRKKGPFSHLRHRLKMRSLRQHITNYIQESEEK